MFFYIAGQQNSPLQARRDLYDQVWRELHSNGLTNTDSLHSTMSGAGLAGSRTTQLGKQFLEFIQEPA